MERVELRAIIAAILLGGDAHPTPKVIDRAVLSADDIIEKSDRFIRPKEDTA